VTLQEWEWVIGVNVKGVINGIRTFVPLIHAHGEQRFDRIRDAFDPAGAVMPTIS
jgi:NAD(P)-dependent dehydrogenase (short-subunit alcohol dehydrogenase family)